MNRFDSLVTGAFRAGLDYEYWPAEQPDSRKVLLVLHGRGDSGEGFHWLPESLDIPEFHYIFLNAPDAEGYGYSWYDRPPHQANGIVRSRGLLRDFAESLLRLTHLASRDLFWFGFSQGCLMSLDLALRAANPFGGVVGVSGYVFFEDEYPAAFSPVLSHQRILITHGDRDELLPLDRTEASIERLRGLGAPIDWRVYDKDHTIDPGGEMRDIRAFYRRLLESA
jgi:phospholipase/carboxylesterase